MKATHIPGPWDVWRGTIIVRQGQQKLRTSDYIGETYAAFNHTIATAEANARLIAAAPELLEALENLVHLHGCEQEGIACGQPTAKQWIDAVEAAQKAIDKAKVENR